MDSSFRFKKAEIGIFNTNHCDSVLNKFAKKCRIIGLTNGNFSLIDLIYSHLKKTGPAKVIIGTWSAGIKDVHQIKWMMDSDLITDIKILTDHSYKTRQKKYAASIEDLFGIENIRTSEMHAKFVLIENNNYKVAIRSSMNLNANKTCELFEIDEGYEIFDFLMEFVLHTFKNMEAGFVESSSKVNECVKRFFEKNNNDDLKQNWWELNNKTE
jgi:hypothetical protein